MASARLRARAASIVEATRIGDELVRLFHDGDAGGFFQTGSDAEELVIRPKELFDNAVPSGNSAAADVLQRLGLLYGDAELERLGADAIRVVRDLLERSPVGFGLALSALDLYTSSAKEIAVVGDPQRTETRALANEEWRRYLPNHVFAAGPATEDVPLLAGRSERGGGPAAYVCERFVCKRPVSEPAGLAAELDA